MNFTTYRVIKRLGAATISSVLAFSLLAGCSGSEKSSSENENSQSDINTALDTGKDITLNVAGAWTDFKAMNNIGDKFNKKYPNCQVNYEYIQDYTEMLPKRLADEDGDVDLFVTSAIQSGNQLADYALNIYSDDRIDISDTFDGLIKNFEFRGSDTPTLYSIPFGAELRGMFVNTTLLDSLDIEIPENYTEFMDACEKLKNAGYIPLQGNPGNFPQRLMYPYICNLIANADDYDSVWQTVNNHTEETAELFREPLQKLYDMVEKGYYNYKFVETEHKMFTDMSNEAVARDFLNITGENENFTKVDDLGTVAFMPSVASQKSVIDKTKNDYHSNINYQFILSPLSDEGGFAYMSPAQSLAINKNSKNLDWSIEFINFIFQTDNSKAFAEDMNITPNTSDAFDLIKSEYNIPQNRISQLGDVTFDYDFYTVIVDTMVDISKSNNPKYMDKDGTQMYDFEYYMDNLKNAFKSVGTEEETDEQQ